MTIGFNLTLGAVLTFFGKWYLYFILWVYPLLSVTIFLNYVRSIGEHLPKGDRYLDETKKDLKQIVRTTTPNFSKNGSYIKLILITTWSITCFLQFQHITFRSFMPSLKIWESMKGILSAYKRVELQLS